MDNREGDNKTRCLPVPVQGPAAKQGMQFVPLTSLSYVSYGKTGTRESWNSCKFYSKCGKKGEFPLGFNVALFIYLFCVMHCRGPPSGIKF